MKSMNVRVVTAVKPLASNSAANQLCPVARSAFFKDSDPQELHAHLEEFLLYGTMAETLKLPSRESKAEYLTQLINSHILDPILTLDTVRTPEVLSHLLRLLAFRIGQELSVGEMAIALGIDGKTVSRYLELLEKAGIILRLGGFSRRLPGEISRKSRYYFLDNGIRNGLLSQFNRLEFRSDAEQLWENFLIAERYKKQLHSAAPVASYFWRTYAGQQLELVEEVDGTLHGYGFKLSDRQTPRMPKAWLRTYPEAHYQVINLNNYLELIT